MPVWYVGRYTYTAMFYTGEIVYCLQLSLNLKTPVIQHTAYYLE